MGVNTAKLCKVQIVFFSGCSAVMPNKCMVDIAFKSIKT